MEEINSNVLLEEAERLVAERLSAWDEVIFDFFVMAGLSGDWQMQENIWNEAWASGNLRLLTLLLLAEPL